MINTFMNQAFKYKLYPTKEQVVLLNQITGSTRWLWNYMLDLNKKKYDSEKKFIFMYDMHKFLPDLKKQHDWLKLAPGQALQQKCTDLDRALKSVWKSSFGFPKFKSKGIGDGFRIPQTNGHIKISDTHITIPKLGEVKWKMHRPIVGKIKSISITKDCNDWYVSVLCEVDDVISGYINKEKIIGIDLGISSFAILSDGTKIESPTFLKKRCKYLKRYQRQLAKRQKGSNNRKKAAIKVAKEHQYIRNQRHDWLHKTSHDLTEKYDLICLEDLKIKSLMKNKKQRSLNKAISDQGWGMFTSMLKYKAERRGKYITKIDQWAPSSKTCSHCGHKMEKMALDIRSWTCPSCGSDHDRDLNAAINIKFWGIMATDNALFEKINTDGTSGIYACGDTSTEYCTSDVQVSLIQEAACPLGPQ